MAVTNSAELSSDSTSADPTHASAPAASPSSDASSSSGEHAHAGMSLAPVPLPLPGLTDAITAMLSAKLAFRASLEVVQTSHEMLDSVVNLAEYGITPD